jgi:hypothetical protein
MAAADTTQKDVAIITVTPNAPNPPVAITLTPNNATVGIGRTQTFVGLVSGGAPGSSRAVIYRSGTPGVATIDASTGVATGVSAGTTVITAIAVADTTQRVTGTLTVVSTVAPSVSIQSVTTNGGAIPGTQIGVGQQIGTGSAAATSQLNVVMNVSAGSETNISRVEVRLNNVECNRQSFSPPLAPTQGVAQITVPCNTATLTAGNLPLFANGTYTLTAVAIDAAGAVVATANYGSIILNNTNVITGTVTFDNTLNDTDNDPASTQAVSGGVLWNGGSATVSLTPAIFSGPAVSTIRVYVDVECDGATAGNPSRAVTISGGTGSVTFSEAAIMAAATPGIDDLQDGSVCFLVGTAADAQGLPVTIPANAGAGNVVAIGTAGATTAAGATQNNFAIDNVEPTVTVAAVVPASPGGNAYVGSQTAFNATTTTIATADGGVAGVTYRFIAVTTSSLVCAAPAACTQAEMATAVATGTAITLGGNLASSSISNTQYTLIVEAKDALGNVVYSQGGTFGVDLENPTIATAAGSIANNSTNQTADMTVAVTDTFSGPHNIQVRGTIYSVLEVDADAGTEVRCLADLTTGAVAPVPASGVCPLLSLLAGPPFLTNVGGQTENGTIVIPDPAADINEGYYVLEVQAIDRAGNLSTSTVTTTTLRDVTAPTATISIITFNTTAGTTSLTGQIRENVDLRNYDTRFTYPGLAGVPDDVPFVTPTAVDSYGLPLTGVVDVNAVSSVTVRDITDQAGAQIVATQFGFGASDIASNYSFTGTALLGNTAGAGVAGLNPGPGPGAGAFDASFTARADATGASNTVCVDRSAATAACPNTSTTLFVQVRTSSTSTNPIANVYFYIVNPGTDNTFGTADDYNVLVAQQSAASATVVTGITDRTFTFSTPVTSGVLPRIGTPTAYPMFAIGVAANGSAVMSDVVTLTIQD